MVPGEQVSAEMGAQAIQGCIDSYRDTPGGLLPLLHAIQDAVGYVPAESVPAIATAMNLSRAEVHGVLSFYHDFRQAPAGRQRVQLCRAEACQAVGARELEAHATSSLDVAMGGTTNDGGVTLDAVYCLGNCACGPSVRINDRVYGRVDAARFDELISDLTGDAP